MRRRFRFCAFSIISCETVAFEMLKPKERRYASDSTVIFLQKKKKVTLSRYGNVTNDLKTIVVDAFVKKKKKEKGK